nr:hypothetical protein CPGR_03163 [Mycolicibacterium komanii]
MVPARAAALDVDDDVLVRHLGRDLDDGLDLVDRARLEHDVADADGVELVDQLDGLLELGDACRHHHAVDRRTGLTGPLHQALAAQLQLPQVRVEEQRVELHRAARLEQGGQLGDAVFEDLLGDLPTAREFGPVPRVRGGRDDLGVDGRRGHAREQDRRTPGQPGELRRQLHRTVRQPHRGGRVARPRRRHLGFRADREQVALTDARGGGHDAHAQPADDRGGQPRHGIAGAQVDDPLRAGLVQPLHLGHPVDRANEDRFGHLVGELGVDTALGRPAVHHLDTVGQPRRVEADLDLHTVEDRAEDRPAADLVLALGLFLLGDLRAVELESAQLLGGAGDDDGTPAVADRQHRRQHGPHILGELLEQFGDAVRIDIRHRDHRGLIPAADHAATAGDQRPGRTDQLQQRQELGVLGASRAQRFAGDDALRMPGHRDRRRIVQVQTLTDGSADRGHLCQQNARAGDGRGDELFRRGQGLVGGERTLPLQGLEADGAHHNQFARHGLEE